MAPYIFSTGTIARVGRGLDPEARASSGSPGIEPGLVVTFAVLLPTAPPQPVFGQGLPIIMQAGYEKGLWQQRIKGWCLSLGSPSPVHTNDEPNQV